MRSEQATRGGGRKRILARVGVACAAMACAVLVTGAPVPLPTPPLSLPTAIPSGYFRVENRGGIWWLIDPLGAPTLTIGVDDVVYEGDRIRGSGASPYLQAAEKLYPDRATWDRHALGRLRSWAFNTLGAWSDAELWDAHTPYTVILDFAARSGADSPRGAPVDVYDPRFEAAAREIARRAATPRAQDPMLVGYFSDNELWWGTDWRRGGTVLGAYLAFPAGAPGRQQAIEFLRKRYGAVQRLNWAWHVHAPDFSLVPATARTAAYRADADAFLELVAARYFSISAQVIHSADPHHLYLGARFAGEPPDPVLRAARAADVVSINLYTRDPRAAVSRVFAITGKPVLISEFSFRALDSGLPNTIGAGPWVFSQWGRAQAYLSYVARVESLPATIGYHWFRWADEPRQGRADGENSNYGLVSLTDTPYQEFLAAVTAANRAAIDVHRGAERAIRAPGRPLWQTCLQTGLDLVLGGPRWLATVVRALSAYWAHTPPAGGT